MQVDWEPGQTEIVPDWGPYLLRPALYIGNLYPQKNLKYILASEMFPLEIQVLHSVNVFPCIVSMESILDLRQLLTDLISFIQIALY